MTLIIGVVCLEGIIIGSDSQTTIGTELKRINKQDPKVIELNSKCIVFTGAGHVSVLQEVEDKVNITLKDCPPDQGLETVRDKIDETIYNIMCKHVKKHVSMFGHLNNMPSGDFLFASWKNGIPLLCNFNVDGSSTRVKDYIALGSGMPYAEVLLKDSYRENLNLEDCKRLVYSVIKNTEDVDNYVGGNIHIKLVHSDGSIETIKDGEILALDASYSTIKDIRKKLDKNWQKIEQKIMKMLDEEEANKVIETTSLLSNFGIEKDKKEVEH